MLTLRCTRKLLKALNAPETAAATQATTVLGDWYANVYDAKPRPIVLCLSERSLLAVILVLSEPKTLLDRFPAAVTDVLVQIGTPNEAIRTERQAMSDIAVGTTANRRLLGCLNEAAFALASEFDSMHERYLGEHALHLSRIIYSTTQYRPPHELARELFQASRRGGRPRLVLVH